MTFFDLVLDTTKEDEGFRAKPYLDSRGYLTIGWGTNIAQGIDHTEATFLLQHRIGLAMRECIRRMPWFGRLDDVRRGVLVRMVYQLGIEGVLRFRRMCAALEAGDYETAATEMLDSKWAREDSPARANREAKRMRTGVM
jgi:lysozyme